MKLAWFGVEEWLNPMDSLAKVNLGSSCVSALRMDELFKLTGEDLDAFLEGMRTMSLHYHHGDATGSPRVKQAVCGIYPKGNVTPDQVMMVHGGTGANDLVLMSVLELEDNCVVVKPSYQQHYDIPKGSGIETRVVQLKAEDNYQLDFDALAAACDEKTKLIVLTNPNNPIGVTLYDEGLRKVIDIAKAAILMPILAPLGDILGLNGQITIVAYQLGDGFTNFFWPTSGVLMAGLAMSGNIPWDRWAKAVWKFMVAATVVSMIVVFVGQAIGVQ